MRLGAIVDARGVLTHVAASFVNDDRRVGPHLSEMRRPVLKRVLVYTLITTTLICMVVGPTTMPLSGGNRYWFFVSFGILIFPVAIVLALIGVELRVDRPRFATFRLMRGLCASCCYELVDVNPEVDGCTVCPECGAAWKLNAPNSERVSE